MRWRRWLKRTLVGLAAVFVAIQLVPFGRAHANPPVLVEPNWDSPVTRDLAVRACYDCHSNETDWPWYTNVAPVSWQLTQHVVEGRDKLNFSEWTGREQETDEMVETIEEGEMPPLSYLLVHSSARLTEGETQQLIDGLSATFGSR